MALLPEAANTSTTLAIGVQPNKSYKMLIDDEKVQGTVDDLDAVEQACYKILNTERYQYVIYSWNYGIELQDLFGKPIPYVFSDLPRRIREALAQDDRVKDVTDFDLSHNRGDVLAKFKVVTSNGVIEMQKGVRIL
ncbi:MAG TPA: DUF2634 domain-containing protein [Selenomonadales bacterium]|nr:DUF2634 domain-containing protein [Selenomonadales bacterium]